MRKSVTESRKPLDSTFRRTQRSLMRSCSGCHNDLGKRILMRIGIVVSNCEVYIEYNGVTGLQITTLVASPFVDIMKSSLREKSHWRVLVMTLVLHIEFRID